MADFDPYLGEIRFFGSGAGDFVDVVLDDGADPSLVSVVVYNSNGTVRSTNSLDATPDNTIAGSDVYSVEAAINKNGAVALVVDGNVVSFVSFHREVTATAGPASGETATQLGTNGSGESFVTSDHGASYTVSSTQDPGVIPCFLSGTRIVTPKGPIDVESLQTGDRVATRDSGVVRLAWVGQRRLTRLQTRAGDFHPICIPKGALGPNTPSRELFLSPNHRVRIAASKFQLLFGAHEVLVPAKLLVGHNGIRVAHEVEAPVYVHLLFAKHELVFSNGLVSESFHPHAMGQRGFCPATREELLALFPKLRQQPQSYGPTQRICLKPHEVALARVVLREAA